ncbi:MAG: alpha/beta hydrolase, partial [Archangium sp.]|nr:alpha/beta hydrolase [Archangium sp.]
RRARTIRDFDDRATAKVFGFGSAEAYYADASTAGQLKNIRVPTLLVSADDDALAPARLLPADVEKNAALHVLRTRHGGHAGYVGGSVTHPTFWAEARVMRWLAERWAST